MNAVVYTSEAGHTARYARMLGEETGLPVYSLAEAAKAVRPGAEIVYLGWLMAGDVKGCRKALGRYTVRAVCAVGMSTAQVQAESARKRLGIPDSVPIFLLQGGYEIDKLTGIYRIMMRTMEKTAGKALANKENRTPEEDDMLTLMQSGGDRVSREKLAPVLDWLRGIGVFPAAAGTPQESE
jgi:hypothetical protein